MAGATGYGDAIKHEDGGPGRSLHNDYIMHQRAFNVLSTSQLSSVRIPRCHRFVSANDKRWWDTHIRKFPEQLRQPCNARVTDRIPPFSLSVRERLINLCCPGKLRAAIKQSEPDQDCLVRPYSGRRRRVEKQSMFQAFSLRNHPLHCGQIEELGLDAVVYARVMAETLAVLYWVARIDGSDVELC